MKKLFKSHKETKTKRVSITDCRIRSKTNAGKQHIVQPTKIEAIDISLKQKHLEEIAMVQKMKRMRKQNALLDLESNTTCYTVNHDRFAQKRSKINPRFTWLCRTDENNNDWINNINMKIGKLGNITEIKEGKRNSYVKKPFKCFKKLGNSYSKLNNAEQYKGLGKYKLSSLNLSEIVTHYKPSFCETFRASVKKKVENLKESIFNKQKGRMISKKRGFPLSRVGDDNSKQTFILENVAMVPQRDCWKVEHRKRHNLSTSKGTRKVKSPDSEILLRRIQGELQNSKIVGESPLGQYIEVRKNKKDNATSNERRLISRQRLYCKYKVTIKNNPIFDLSIARNNHIKKLIH